MNAQNRSAARAIGQIGRYTGIPRNCFLPIGVCIWAVLITAAVATDKANCLSDSVTFPILRVRSARLSVA